MNNHTSSLEPSHFPVMLNEVLKITSPFNGGKYIDCTFGGGGYSKEILKIPKTEIAAIDRDNNIKSCLLYTSPSPRDRTRSRMPSSA